MNTNDIVLWNHICEHVAIQNATTQTVTGLVVQYYGAFAYAKVAVAAGGDMTFSCDDTDGTTVSTTIGASGVLDVSTAAYDTVGEVVDHVNASGDWRIMAVGMRRADSTNNTLAELAAASATGAAGLNLAIDEVVSFKAGFSISHRAYTSTSGSNADGDTTDVGWQNELAYLAFNSTFASGTSNMTIYEIDDDDNSETEIFTLNLPTSETAVAVKFVDDYGLSIKPTIGKRILVQLVNSAAMALLQMTGMGKFTQRA